MKYKILNFIFLILTVACLFAFIRIYNSYSQQRFILTDLNQSSWSERSEEFVENIEVDFPNLSLTALNLKAAKAQYYLYKNDFKKGLALLDESIKENSNPYIMFNEATYAKIYNAVGVRDSAYYFARKAFKGLPRNPFHFSELARMYAQQSISDITYIDSIQYYFKQIQYPAEHQIWKVYLASVSNFIDQIDKEFPLRVAKETFEVFPNRDDVQVAAYYVLYGEENTKTALKAEAEGRDLFTKGNFDIALKKFKIADSLQPINIVHKENIASTYFNLKDWNSTIDYLKMIESEHELDLIQNYILGLSYYNTSNLPLGCQKLQRALEQGNKKAEEAISILCFSQ